MMRIRLGWLQLRKEKLRSTVALAGVAFAVTLILMNLGFRAALFESAVRYHERLVYDIALLNPETNYIVNMSPFSSRRLHQARGLDAVDSVSPVYARLANWKNPSNLVARPIFVLGIDPSDRGFVSADVARNLDRTRIRDVVLFDRASRPEYGPVAAQFEGGQEVRVEVNHREIKVDGLFKMGTSFGIDGSLITSETNFLRLFPDRQRGLIDLGLIRLRDGEDPEAIRRVLRSQLPGDVLVLTKAEFARRERHYWDKTTPIGYVFSFGVIIGFVVGSIIVYQILFADVSDHLAEYATLKAVGYSNAAVSSVVIEQGILLAVLGFVPGLAVSTVLYDTAGAATRLPMHLTTERILLVLGLTVAMCCVAGLMALRKVRAADPAEIF